MSGVDVQRKHRSLRSTFHRPLEAGQIVFAIVVTYVPIPLLASPLQPPAALPNHVDGAPMISVGVVQIRQDQDLEEPESAARDVSICRVAAEARGVGRLVVLEGCLEECRARLEVANFNEGGAKLGQDGQIVWKTFQDGQKRASGLVRQS